MTRSAPAGRASVVVLAPEADRVRAENQLVIGEWVRWMRGRGMAQRTMTERSRFLTHVAERTGQLVTEFTPEALSDYLADLPKASTRGTYHAHLRAFHFWLRKYAKLRVDDPLEDVGRPIVPRATPRPIGNAHFEALIATRMKRHTFSQILIAAFQGWRVHEVAKVAGEDFDLIENRVRVIGKGDVEKWPPLHPVVRELCAYYPRHGWWFPSPYRPGQHVHANSLSRSISEVMRRAGVPGTAHSLRHWFGTELVAAGVDLRTVQELMRHAMLSSTAIYTGISEAQQRNGIERLPVVSALGTRSGAA